MQLRPYQAESEIEVNKELDRGGRPLLQLATGAGKTIVASAIINQYLGSGKRVLFLAHRIELLRQGRSKIGLHPSLSIQSVQGHKYDGFVDLIVTDEAHHAIAKTYQDIYRQYPSALRFGMTATPARGDGRGLGTEFTKLICVTSANQLIEQKYLAPINVFVPEHTIDAMGVKKTAGNYQARSLSKVAATDVHCQKAVEEYRSKANGRRGLVFCVDRDHSRKMAAYYCAAGYNAIHLDGKTHKKEREKAIELYHNGEVDIITNCNLFKEGLDLPQVDFVQCLVNTTSLVDYWQMIGRGMRPGDDALIFLDHTNNWRTIGLPDDESITFSLLVGASKEKTGKKRVRRDDGSIEVVDGDDDEWVTTPSTLVSLDAGLKLQAAAADFEDKNKSPLFFVFISKLNINNHFRVSKWKGNKSYIRIRCPEGHEFDVIPQNYTGKCNSCELGRLQKEMTPETCAELQKTIECFKVLHQESAPNQC